MASSACHVWKGGLQFVTSYCTLAVKLVTSLAPAVGFEAVAAHFVVTYANLWTQQSRKAHTEKQPRRQTCCPLLQQRTEQRITKGLSTKPWTNWTLHSWVLQTTMGNCPASGIAPGAILGIKGDNAAWPGAPDVVCTQETTCTTSHRIFTELYSAYRPAPATTTSGIEGCLSNRRNPKRY